MVQTDIEAGVHILNAPAPSVLAMRKDDEGIMGATPMPVSRARELTTPANQTRSRSRPLQNAFSIFTAQSSRPHEPQNQFFESLQKRLEHGGREHCLFMCWEHGFKDQRAVPLLIRDSEDEAKVYQDLVKLWYKTHGWWWRYVPFYQILEVEEVEFRFLKRQENDYSITIEKLDIPRIEARLTRELLNAEARLNRLYNADGYCASCYQDTVTGQWIHENHDCLHEYEPYQYSCPFENQLECKRKLIRLKLLSLPLLCFRDPEKAACQRTLQGLAQESCIYRTSEIKGTNCFEPWVAEAKFRGLVLRCSYTWKYRPLDVPAVAMMIVTLWKVSGGSWEAAFAAGTFFIMLVSLPPMTCK